MTDEEKAEFINETTEKICDWCASEQKKIKQAIKEALEKGLAEGCKEVTYMKASEYDEYLNICRTNDQLKAELEQWRQECQDAQIKSYEEGFARTTIQIKYSELEKKNEELKAQIPQWHDLRKNPDDLPKEYGEYQVCYENSLVKGRKEHAIWQYVYDKWEHTARIIAWCELPTYKE